MGRSSFVLALHGAYYDNNFGDLLLVKTFERWVRAVHDGPIIYPRVPASEATSFQAAFPDYDQSHGRTPWDALIVTGGGHYSDNGSGRYLPGTFEKRFFRESIWPVAESALRRKPYAIIGPEVGPLNNLPARLAARYAFRHASAVSVRNPESVEFVQREFGMHRNVLMVPDPAVTVSPEHIPASAVDEVAALLGEYPGARFLGVHHPRDFVSQGRGSSALRAALLRELRKHPDIVPVAFSDIGNGDRSGFIPRLAELIRQETGRPCIEVPFPGLWQTVALIGRLSAVITSKLHVGIVGYALGVHVESVPYHAKVQRFYRQTERAQHSVALHQVTDDDATTIVRSAFAAAENPRDLKDDLWSSVRSAAERHGALVAAFIEASRSGRKRTVTFLPSFEPELEQEQAYQIKLA